MKAIIFLLSSAIMLSHFGDLGTDNRQFILPSRDDTTQVSKSAYQEDFFQKTFFTQSDAEKILGEKAHLSDSSSAVKKDTLEFKSTYITNLKDPASDKPVAIYFMIEKYHHVSSAANAYRAIMVANQDHEGFETLHNLGDEAYFHTDKQNFYFILVRKGEKMFRIKVNKITAKTSLKEFNNVATKITSQL